VAVAIEVPHGPVADTLLERGFAVHVINPKQLDRLRDRFSIAGAKDDRRDARVAAAGLRTDPHLFRAVQAGDPGVIELREWSRMAEELQQERVRLANRIRRLDAASALDLLRQPAITVAAGVTEAAVLHLRSLVVRLRVANAEFRQAECKLEELCIRLSQDAAAGENGSCDAAILRSLPGVGTVTLATLLTEAGDPLARRDHAALRTLSGVAPVAKRSGKTCIVVMRYAAQVRLRQAVFHRAASPFCTIPRAAAATTPCEDGVTPMAARCVASPTACSGWPASCCSGRCCSTLTTVQERRCRPGHPLVRQKRPSLRPDRLAAERRAQAVSRRPRSGTGAMRRRAASWTARARRYARRVGKRHPISGHTGRLNPSSSA